MGQEGSMSWEILETERKSGPSLNETKGGQTESEKLEKEDSKEMEIISSAGAAGKREKEVKSEAQGWNSHLST